MEPSYVPSAATRRGGISAIASAVVVLMFACDDTVRAQDTAIAAGVSIVRAEGGYGR